MVHCLDLRIFAITGNPKSQITGIHNIVANAKALPYRSESVRVALFNESLHWFPVYEPFGFGNPIMFYDEYIYRLMIRKAWQVLEPGGWLLIKPGTHDESMQLFRNFEGDLCERLLRELAEESTEVLRYAGNPVMLWARKPFNGAKAQDLPSAA